MKICFVSASRPHTGGMVNYLNNMTRGLHLLGHQTDIVSIFGTEKERKIRSKLDTFLGKILGSREWLNFLAIQFIKAIIFFRLLKNHLQKKYDFIYVTDVISANAIRPIEKIFKIPVILNPIDALANILAIKNQLKLGSWFYHYILKQEKKAYIKAQARLSIGIEMEKYFQKIANDDNLPFPVIDIPFDDTKYYPDEKAGRLMKNRLNLNKKFIVLFIGRLSPEKGVLYLLKAMPEILKQEPNTNISIICGGPGPEKEKYKKYIINNNLQNYAAILGYINEKDIRGIYNMCDIFCTPPITLKSGLIKNSKTIKSSELLAKNLVKQDKFTISAVTTTIQEAMACGKSVIGTNIIGLKETIKENFNGLLVEERNSRALARAILTFKNNPKLRKKMAQNALITAKNRYLPIVTAKSLIDYYKIIFNQ